MRPDGIQDESRERQRTRKFKAEPDGAARPPRTAPDHPGQLPPRCSGALLRTPHREGHPPRPGVHPSVQRRIFRGPRRMGKPRRNLRWNFSMGYPTHAPPKEQASWLLGFPTSRDHPLTWRVGWSRTYVAPHHSFEHPKTRNHGISWGILGIAGEFVNQRGWCSRL